MSLINKKRKTAPKASDYLDTLEVLEGSAKRKQVEQETKRRCTDFKEAQTLKLVKLDNGGGALNVHASASGAALPPAPPAQPAPPRYDEDDDSDES